MSLRTITVLLAVTILPTHLLPAAVIPGRWEKVQTLEAGSEIIVSLQQGDRFKCLLKEVADEHLVVTREDQSELRLLRPAIRKVTSAEAIDDSTRSGTLIGLGVGFGVGFVTTVAFERSKTASGYSLADENLGWALLGGAIGAAGGALVGRALDAGKKNYEVLYEAR